MSIVTFVLLLLVAAIVGFLGDAMVPGDIPFVWLGSIIAGLLGAWLGGMLLGSFGPALGGVFIIPAIVGAVILVVLFELVIGRLARRTY